MNEITGTLLSGGHEIAAFGADEQTGMRALVVVHDTSLGPGLGPPRLDLTLSEPEAYRHAVEFSRQQTFKYAVAGLPYGGARAVIFGMSRATGRPALLRAFGRFIDSLGGNCITSGGGAGLTESDTFILMESTRHIMGLPESAGGSGEPAVMAAYGIFWGLKACTLHAFGEERLSGRRIALQGTGRVGSALARLLTEEGCELTVADKEPGNVERIREKFGARVVSPEEIYDQEVDVFAPCALGGTINDETIPRLRCRIVAGAANNQLTHPVPQARRLAALGILYAPDYVLNAGGFINITAERGGYDPDRARARVRGIRDTVDCILVQAEEQGITPLEAADHIAAARLHEARARRPDTLG